YLVPGRFRPNVRGFPWADGRKLKGPYRMIKVKSRGNETAEQMLRRFKKMCEKEGLTKDIKRIAYYEKPSEKRRRRVRTGKKPMRMGS
ncbi:MAG TPA: 30S ribosomal protein S21, partial [Tepidisphaeraceae bacterium]|nr:30S ribosomal protein S21 [Tepidisphaeraceae bacterium]